MATLCFSPYYIPVNKTVDGGGNNCTYLLMNVNDTWNGPGVEESVTYQWLRNGSALIEMPGKFEGVNTLVLTIIDARSEDEDSYQCVIGNGTGDNVTSNKAFLSVGKVL